MPPLVRRRTFLERIKSNLDPSDILLWLSEELNDDAFADLLNRWAFSGGIVLNLLFILLRGASKPPSTADGEIFADNTRSGQGWFAWISTAFLYILTALCCFNAYLVIFQKKDYRLFEQPLDQAPASSSAHKVSLGDHDSSPTAWTYLVRALAHFRGTDSDQALDQVWEISIWDPKPYQLTLFTLFSPGHVLLYYTLLPASVLHPRPSMTALLALIFGAVLSIQLNLTKRAFESQIRDRAIVQGQVLNEYEIKYVRPSLNHLVRDVGVQTRESALRSHVAFTREVDIYTPTGRATRRISRQAEIENRSPSTKPQDRAVSTARRRSLFGPPAHKTSRSSISGFDNQK